jgi:hypothetical protein
MGFQEIKTTFKVGTRPWMGRQMYLFVLFLTVIMRSVFNDVSRGERAVVGMMTPLGKENSDLSSANY